MTKEILVADAAGARYATIYREETPAFPGLPLAFILRTWDGGIDRVTDDDLITRIASYRAQGYKVTETVCRACGGERNAEVCPRCGYAGGLDSPDLRVW
jgi:hypothetical protein